MQLSIMRLQVCQEAPPLIPSPIVTQGEKQQKQTKKRNRNKKRGRKGDMTWHDNHVWFLQWYGWFLPCSQAVEALHVRHLYLRHYGNLRKCEETWLRCENGWKVLFLVLFRSTEQKRMTARQHRAMWCSVEFQRSKCKAVSAAVYLFLWW